jgi:hypothetical protein
MISSFFRASILKSQSGEVCDHVSDIFAKANAVQTNGHNKELMSRINGGAWSAIKYRDHIRKIVKDNYTKRNMVSDVPSAERLLELVL